jgi:predicted O-methyltransferase YrrM
MHLRAKIAQTRDKFALGRVLDRPHLIWGVLEQHSPPRLLDLHKAAVASHDEAIDLAADLLPDLPGSLLLEYQAEYDVIAARIERRAAAVDARYPEYFTVEAQMSRFLYTLVRAVNPKVVLETGVADGRSTAIILAAMEANGSGRLHSVEISSEVGTLVEDRSRWELHVLDPATADFERLVEELGDLDVFLHDGDHSYAAQTREYEAVWPRLRESGFLVSDDVEFSWAFLRFCTRHELEPYLLSERRKAVGVVRR